MKRIFLTACCIILSIHLSGCGSPFPNSKSTYQNFTAKNDIAAYTMTGSAQVDDTFNILYMTVSENTTVHIKGTLKDLSGDIQILYINPENEEFVIAGSQDIQKGKLKLDADIPVEKGEGRIEFRGSQVSFKYNLLFSGIDLEKIDYFNNEKNLDTEEAGIVAVP